MLRSQLLRRLVKVATQFLGGYRSGAQALAQNRPAHTNASRGGLFYEFFIRGRYFRSFIFVQLTSVFEFSGKTLQLVSSLVMVFL